MFLNFWVLTVSAAQRGYWMNEMCIDVCVYVNSDWTSWCPIPEVLVLISELRTADGFTDIYC